MLSPGLGVHVLAGRDRDLQRHGDHPQEVGRGSRCEFCWEQKAAKMGQLHSCVRSRGQIEYVKEVRLSWRLLGWWYEKLKTTVAGQLEFWSILGSKLFQKVDPPAGQKDQMSCCFCRCFSFSWPSRPWGSCALASVKDGVMKSVWNCCLLNWDEFRILHCLILLVSSCRILTLQYTLR